MAEEETKIGSDTEDEKKALKYHEGGDNAADSVVTSPSFNDASYVKILPSEPDRLDVSDSIEFVCLKKEDLIRYANDPFWVRVRVVLLILFALAWIGMLSAAIAIIVLAPKCPPVPHLDWWQKAVIYHVHPQSFLDSNGDGFGDIKG